MKELTERSRALQQTILRNKALLGELSERIAQVLDGRVDMPADQAYVFVPRVFRRPLFLPEIFMAASDADMIEVPGGLAGPYDPWIIKILDKERLAIKMPVDPDPVPWKGLREQILADSDLLGELSQAIAEVLEKHGVSLEADETFAFEPVTAPRPIFGSELAARARPVPRRYRRVGRMAMAARAQIDWSDFVPPWEKGVIEADLLVALEQQRLPRG